MPKNVVNCLSLNDFRTMIDMYVSSWSGKDSIFINRSDYDKDSYHGLYLSTVLDVHNNSVIYKYIFTYDDYLHLMTYRIELAHFG